MYVSVLIDWKCVGEGEQVPNENVMLSFCGLKLSSPFGAGVNDSMAFTATRDFSVS